MFHTFQSTAATVHQAVSRNNPKTRRQSSTTHACEECRRRKIRCDGKLPCSHCEWYKHPKLCRYSKKQPRVVPSQKLLDELSSALKQSQKVIEQLFPNADVKSLGEMPRNELIELLLSLPPSQPPSSTATSPVLSVEGGMGSNLRRVKSEDAAGPLEALEEEPAADGYWDETQASTNGVPAIPDDVNALSMSAHRQSSYVGVSSVAAALRVISKITTALESVITSSPPNSSGALLPDTPQRPESSGGSDTLVPPLSATFPPPSICSPGLKTSILIDAYFVHVHPMIPMIDEKRFRANSEANTRKDAAWLALLNMVYAMGTIAASTAEDNSHLHYYRTAKQHLDLEMLGSGSIEAVQALGILGGYYLHYESKPNMASAVMGAAMRMACALGLHREYSEAAANTEKKEATEGFLASRDVRRRTWWSLFCLDTWASTTTGRPSLGRISAGVNVALPMPSKGRIENSDSGETEDDVYMMLLCQQTAFCKIATRVQDRLAESPLLPYDEMARFDAELRHWYNNLPSMLRWPEPCPNAVKTPRAVLSWRYHNLRIVLHRPALLNNALRSSLEHPEQPTDEEMRAVDNCRRIGGEAIEDIKNQWEASQIAGWNAVWLLFQAAMVPLVTLFAEYNRSNFEAVRDAQGHVQSVIDQLEIMQDWSVTAKRSRDVVSKIFERNKLLVSHAREVLEFQRQQQKEKERRRRQDEREREREEHRRSQSRSNSHSQSPVMRPPSGRSNQAAMYTQAPQIPGVAFPSFDRSPPVMGSQHMSMYSHGGSISPPAAVSMEGSTMGMLPEGLMPPPGGHTGLGVHMGVNVSSSVVGDNSHLGTNYINEDELNAFWNQIMWGDNEVNGLMVENSMDMMQYVPEHQPGPAFGY